MGQPAPTRTQHLLLDTDDRENVARQRDLAGHGEVGPDRAACERRHQSRHQRDPTRGPVLLLHGCLHVQMQIRLPEGGLVQAVPPRVRPDPRHGVLADSFITSPSDPVKVSSPAPGIRHTSTNSTLPPYGVHPSPSATPGNRMRSATSGSTNVGAPSLAATVSGVITALDSSPSVRRRATFRHNVSSSARRDTARCPRRSRGSRTEAPRR